MKKIKINFIKTLILVFITFSASSCANNLKALGEQQIQLKAKHTLNSYLALEYWQYSAKLSKYDYKNSQYFAKKGLKVAEDEEIFPESPENWGLNGASLIQANFAREKLTIIFDNPKARQNLAPQLARLHLLYDCWISKETSKFQLEDMASCKIEFFKLEDEVRNYSFKEDKVEVKDLVVDINKEPEFTKFDIYFDLNLYKFNSEADKIFEDLFNYLGTLQGNYKILLVGGADRTGKKLSNDSIARKRSLLVKSRLVKNGIPENLISTTSTSTEYPEIITVDGTQNKYNRKVSIYVLKGKDNISEIPLPLIDQYIYKSEVLKIKKKRGIN